MWKLAKITAGVGYGLGNGCGMDSLTSVILVRFFPNMRASESAGSSPLHEVQDVAAAGFLLAWETG